MRNTFKLRAAGIGIAVVMCAAGGVIVMLLWNALLPRIFGLPQIGYLEAVGVLVLARVLFGSLGGGMYGRGGGHRGMRGGGYPYDHVNKIREKWMNMSDEERREFIKKERDFAGFHRHHSRFHDCEQNAEGGANNGGAKKDNSNE